MKNNFKISILNRGDFDYLHVYIYIFPDIEIVNNHGSCGFDHSEKTGITAVTEISYTNSQYETGEVYFYSIVFRILGFGFSINQSILL